MMPPFSATRVILMLRILSVLLLCFVTSLNSWAQLTISDDDGQHLVLDQPAERIVVLAPHLAELVYAAGAGDRLVAAVEYCDFPPEVAQLPQVGNGMAISMERLLALQPDLILAWKGGTPVPLIQQLRDLKLPVVALQSRSIESVASQMETIGRLAGTSQQARRAAREFRERLQVFQQRSYEGEPVAVFYQIWHQPLMSISPEHSISYALRLCGGRNIITEMPTEAATVSLETVLLANPEIILASGAGAGYPAWLDEWKKWPELRAVQGGHLYAIDPDLMNRPGPRLLDGLERLCELVERARATRK